MDTQPHITKNGHARGWHRLIGPAVILLAALIAIAPQLIRGNSCGHDFDVHLVSWLDCLNAWKHGILYPHWTPSPNYAAGEPRFVFYPPLTWMLGAALGAIFQWAFAPIAFTFLCLAGTGLATRALALEVFSDAQATLAGCAALFSGFTLFTAYERSAFPEFTGGVWLPLLLLFALRDRRPTDGILRRALDGSAAPLAVALGAAWLSNAPLGVIASYLLAAVALIAAVLKKSWAPVVRAAVAVVLGLGATAFYWIPAALERRWVDIRQATEDPGYNFENNWLFARHANPALALHDEVLRTASWIAVSMIAVAIVCLAISWLRGTLPAEKRSGFRLWWIPLAVVPFVTLFLLFPISWPVWHLPEMKFLQYPWRWMEAVEAPMAIFFAAAVWTTRRWARVAVVACCGTGFLAATIYAATAFFAVCYPEDTPASVVAAHSAGSGFEGMYEYEPPNADITLIANGLPDACLVSDPMAPLGKPDPDGGNPIWNAAQSSCKATFSFDGGRGTNPEHLRLRADAPEGGYLVLRLLSYPAWAVKVNGNALDSLAHRDDGLIVVPAPRGTANVSIDWATSPDVALSRWVSLLGLAALAILWLAERGIRRVQLS